MKRNFLSMVVMGISLLVLFGVSWAQCPEDPNDLGFCDTLHVVPWPHTDTCYVVNYPFPDTICINEPGENFPCFWYVHLLVTHDSNTFWWEDESKWIQDSIAAFVVPLLFHHQSTGGADSVIFPFENMAWNNPDMSPFFPWMDRSMFRHFVDSRTGDTVYYNRMLQMVEAGNAAWNVYTDIDSVASDGDSGHVSLALPIMSPTCRRWWEGERTLLATLTFIITDTMHICFDSTFWEPANQLTFTRHDAALYFPRHNLPQCIWVGPPRIEVTSPNGGETWSAGDDHDITWISEGSKADVTIEYSTNGGADWDTVIATTPDNGVYSWNIPNTPSTECRVKVSDAADGDPSDMSDDNFTIAVSNEPPVVSDIPDQTITEGESFASISLDDYVTDPDNSDDEMTWTYWGNVDLLVDITDRVATITVPNPEWSGAETIWFKACDPGGLCDSNEATFTVTAVNDTPVVSDIPNQTITEGESFASISLDNYVTDPDDHDSVMIWTHWGNVDLLVDVTDRVATISVPNPEWNGAETIWFKACDPGGLCDSNEATFTVTAVNDTPVVSDIPDQTIAAGESFASISLDNYVTDPDDHDSVMIWTHWGETELLVDITDRVATISVPSPDWNGSETIWFKACDPGGLCDSNEATFTVTEQPDFAIDVIPDTLEVPRGYSDDYKVILTSINGFTSPCTLTVAGYPDGSTATFEDSVLVPTDSTILTIAIPDTTTPNTFTLTITATEMGKEITHSKDVTLIVTLPNWYFAVDAFPDTQTVVPGEDTIFYVRIIPQEQFGSPCTLCVYNLPPWTTAVFDDSIIKYPYTDTSILTVATADTTPEDEYTLTIEGRCSRWTRYDEVTLIVQKETDVEDEGGQLNVPDKFALFQNQPNPFNPETNISYYLSEGCEVKLTIYNILGRRVKTLCEGYQSAGMKTLVWDGRDNQGEQLGSGIYFYRLQAGEFIETRKMTLIK